MKIVKNSVRFFSFCVLVVVLSLPVDLVCELDQNANSSASILVSVPSIRPAGTSVSFSPKEKTILMIAAAKIKKSEYASKIPEYFKALYTTLHRSLGEVLSLKKTKNTPAQGAPEPVQGEVASQPAGDNVISEEEQVACQKVISDLRQNLDPQVFVSAHGEIKSSVHPIIEKIIKSRFGAEAVEFKSHCMKFLTLPSGTGLEASIEGFFKDIRTFGSLSQFLSELLVVLEGLRTHLPDGEKILGHMASPPSLDVVNDKKTEQVPAQ